MLKLLKAELQKLTGTRGLAAGGLAIYIVSWLSGSALTFIWEKILEKQAPWALKLFNQFLATETATGGALVAALLLFAPPVIQWLLDFSAAWAQFFEAHSKRVSKREYLAELANEAIKLAQTAREVVYLERWDRVDEDFVGIDQDRYWQMMEEKRREQAQRQAAAMRAFVAGKLGRANFLQTEFKKYGFADDVPPCFFHVVNTFTLSEMALILERSANTAIAELLRDGYLPQQGNEKLSQ